MRELTGAVVVVVGATGDLGASICDELLHRGAIVLGASRNGPDIHMDLRDSRAGDAVVRGALGTQGRLDGVVNAAGVVAYGDVMDTDDVTIEELFLTNAIGPLWLARHLLPTLAESNGFFFNVTAMVAETPLSGLSALSEGTHHAAYGASKAALSHALGGLRREAIRMGVHIADVRPPSIATGLASRAIAGSPPVISDGLDPDDVAVRVVDAIQADEYDVGSGSFGCA